MSSRGHAHTPLEPVTPLAVGVEVKTTDPSHRRKRLPIPAKGSGAFTPSLSTKVDVPDDWWDRLPPDPHAAPPDDYSAMEDPAAWTESYGAPYGPQPYDHQPQYGSAYGYSRDPYADQVAMQEQYFQQMQEAQSMLGASLPSGMVSDDVGKFISSITKPVWGVLEGILQPKFPWWVWVGAFYFLGKPRHHRRRR